MPIKNTITTQLGNKLIGTKKLVLMIRKQCRLEHLKMNKINDRDLTELSSYMVYQDINKDNNFTVNEKRFKQADVFEDLYREKL